jgi:transcriptional regulator with XRE-family HTH domain
MSSVVARNLRAERSRLGLRQEDLADRLKIDRTTVSAWEVGKAAVGIDWLVPICQALEVDLAVLLQGMPPTHLQALGVPDLRAR